MDKASDIDKALRLVLFLALFVISVVGVLSVNKAFFADSAPSVPMACCEVPVDDEPETGG